MKCLRRISSAVDRGLTSFYRMLGRFIARRPWVVITVGIVITLVCCVGFLRFEVEEDAEKLYTPQDAESFEGKAYVDKYYRSDSLSVKILTLDKAEAGANVLTKDYLLEHLRAFNTITSQVVESNGQQYPWPKICATTTPNSTECKIDSILQFWNYDERLLLSDVNLINTINNRAVRNYEGAPINLNWVLGGVQRDATGAVVRAEVLQTVFYLRNEGEDDSVDSITFKWQDRITEVAFDKWYSPITSQYVSSDGAVGRESSEAINRDVQRLSVGYILLIIYVIFALWQNSWAYQKAHVALGSFLAIGMGIGMDFGLLSGLGVKFNFVCQVLPFLLVGVGVDNTFVIVSNYFDQDPDSPIEHRMGEALGLAGSSITVSCLTNVIAFAVGTYTTLEALLSFSIYASVGTFLVFVFQVTVFPAFLTLDARRELRVRRGVGCPGFGCALPCCCQKDPVADQLQFGNNGWTLQSNVYKHDHVATSAASASYAPSTLPSSSLEAGGGNSTPTARAGASSTSAGDLAVKVIVRPPSPEKIPPVQKQASGQFSNQQSGVEVVRMGSGGSGAPVAWGLQRDFTTPTIWSCCSRWRVFNPHADQIATKLIARWLPAVTLNVWGKIVVVVLECIMLGFAIYGCTKVYMDFNFREMFVPEGNWLHKAYQVEDRYFGGEKVPVAIYTRETVDGRDYFYYQDQLAALTVQLSASSYITEVPPVSNWYDSYQAWLNRPNSTYASQLVDGRAPNETAFNSWLQTWLKADGRPFADNLLIDPATGRIFGSRITAFTEDVVDGSWAVKCVDATRQIAKDAAPDLNAVAFGFSYTFWDGFRTIATSTVLNVVIAASMVFLVTLILLADIVASLLVGLMVVLCDVGVFGFMYYADLQFNSVTCIVLVLAVGIAVDYSAHVMRAFLVSTGTRQERAHKALVEIGGAVWNGAVTTFLAVLPMATAEHYIFTTIFAMFAVLVLLSIWHGLVLLPVIMSVAGPPSYRDLDEQKETGGTKVMAM